MVCKKGDAVSLCPIPHVPGTELGLVCEGRRRWTFNQSTADADGFPSAGLCFSTPKGSMESGMMAYSAWGSPFCISSD